MCYVRGMLKQETIFLLSEFTQLLWNRLLKWLNGKAYNARSWDHHLQWPVRNFKGKSQAAKLFKLVYAECVYSIWIERNQRVFEHKSRGWENIAKEIVYLCNVRAHTRIRNIVQQLIFLFGYYLFRCQCKFSLDS